MRSWKARGFTLKGTVALGLLLGTPVVLRGAPEDRSADRIWQQGVRQILQGEFDQAGSTLEKLPEQDPVTGTVVDWLEDFRKEQEERHELDEAEFNRYVDFAKVRIERGDYDEALRWAILARDVSDDREAFLKADWLHDLVDRSLEAAEAHRGKQEWQEAWLFYSYLGELFEHEPRYKKLEKEVLTHWRLDEMFTEKAHWEESIENVRWDDARRALESIALYYVVPPDFKAMAEDGLDAVLLLADSKSAQKQFERLGNERNRAEFVARINALTRGVQESPDISRRDVERSFRRVLDISRQTVELPESLVVSEMMRGAFEPLDDFTTIIWPQDADDFEKHTRGDFIGVGISIVKNRATEEIEVVSPLEDTPAYRAGIQAGDIITHVNGDAIKGLSINKVVDTITGPEGSEVELTVRRDDEKLNFKLERARVKIQSVKGLRRHPIHEERWEHWLDEDRGIGYIRITGFQANTVEDVTNVLSELEAGDLRGLVLDLRDNPGGLLDSAFDLSSLFLKKGEKVVVVRGRDPDAVDTLRATSNGPWSDLPVLVLVNDNSASASEIVAGAIQDNEHGVVMGERTFGKFSVQNLIQLSRSNAKLKLTTAKYYLPNGRSLHREITSSEWGVEPDIHVRLTRWERVNVWKARREADRLGPPKPGADDDDIGAVVSKDKEDEIVGPPPFKEDDENDRPMADPQLDAALLVMRVRLIENENPTLAAVDVENKEEIRKP
ncbi:MAG: S41 family peptidase [Phycisphaerae bacterium]|nr:S41 family peptidase [Phycisphaerae bacterium]